MLSPSVVVSLFLLCLSGFAHADNYISVSVVQNKYIVFTDMKEMKVKSQRKEWGVGKERKMARSAKVKKNTTNVFHGKGVWQVSVTKSMKAM